MDMSLWPAFFGPSCICLRVGHAGDPCRIAKLIKMPFTVQTCLRSWNHVLDGGDNSATWQIRLNDPCTSAMLPYVKLLWPLVTCTYQSYKVVMLLTFILIIIISSIPSPLTLSFQAQNLPFPQIVAFLFFYRTDSTDSSDCSPILLSISVWYL